MAVDKGRDWLPHFIAVVILCGTLTGFIGGAYFQGFVGAGAISHLKKEHDADHELAMESIRRRYENTDDQVAAIVKDFQGFLEQAQTDRSEIKTRISDLALQVRSLEVTLNLQ